MGGQDGNRGYLLQATIAVLDSISNAGWEYVSIEPDSVNEKVDIKWWDVDGNQTVYQVKSSINNFDKSDILQILYDLTTDAPQATKFSIVLLGTYSGDTKKFFNSFSEQKKEAFGKYSNLDVLKNKIVIDLKALDIRALDGQTISEVHKFLSARQYIVHHSGVELIALGLGAQFSRFATKGNKITRIEFEMQILNWAQFNYPGELKQDGGSLKMSFYNAKKVEDNYSPATKQFSSELYETAYLQNMLGELYSLKQEIDAINLPVTLEPPEYNNPNRLKFVSPWPILGDSPAALTGDEIKEIMSLSKIFLDIVLENEFFQVGQVKFKKMEYSSFLLGSRFAGTIDEVKKRELLQDFKNKLETIEDLTSCWAKLKEYKLVPLIVVNETSKMHTNIELQMYVGRNEQVLTAETFPKPGFKHNMEFFSLDEGFLEKLFTLQQDSRVKAYDNRQRFRPIKLPLIDPIFGRPTEDYVLIFEQSLKWVFDYNIYDDQPFLQTLACTFNSIKSGDAMALPAYFFIKTGDPITIKYMLRSDQSGSTQGTFIID